MSYLRLLNDQYTEIDYFAVGLNRNCVFLFLYIFHLSLVNVSVYGLAIREGAFEKNVVQKHRKLARKS